MTNVVSGNNTVDIDKILSEILVDENLNKDDEFLYKCVFDKINAKLIIKIKGDNYNCSFPASFAQSLVEVQDNFYRAVSIALFGEENLKRLNSSYRDKYQLTFTIKNGSTEVESDYQQSLINLVTTAMSDMSSVEKIILLVTLALIVGGVYLGRKYMETKLENNKETEQTKRFYRAIDKLTENNEKNVAAILKGIKDADKATINEVEYSKADIQDASRRANRISHTSEIMVDYFRIFAVETKHQTISKFTLSNPNTGEFTALFDEDEFCQDDIDKIWDAIRNKRQINLALNLDKQENKIKQSTILSIQDES
ncbi:MULTISPECIES: hypothetical protein [Snodgrassella]|uniref:hypothetical protein n=1 Tax=Snodgrassella TaxID=1193515 RepID=UPI0018DB680A|nr:hypothetical protein [Snodgrassella sp. M0351]MBI0164808.1 hypothetical protein [Snodgrassella sp. M0351]